LASNLNNMAEPDTGKNLEPPAGEQGLSNRADLDGSLLLFHG
jgi:hypothetical protein